MSNVKQIIKKTFLGKILLRIKRANDIRGYGYVFMLHRVAGKNPNGLTENENLKVTPEFLESFITENKEKYDFIATDKIFDYIKTNKNGKKFICFTLDDGYKDNFTSAYPIFKKHQVPFTIFISSSFPQKTAFLWWLYLEDLILANDRIRLSDGTEYDCSDFIKKNSVFWKLRMKVLDIPQDKLEGEFKNLFSEYQIDVKSKDDELCMNPEEIKILSKEPLFCLGGHTQNHANLKSLESYEDVKSEILNGKNYLAEITGTEPKVFAYPYGTSNEVGEREIKAVKESGFKTAFMLGGGAVKNPENRFSIPRIPFYEGFSFENYLRKN